MPRKPPTRSQRPGAMPTSISFRRRLKGKRKLIPIEARIRIIRAVVESPTHWYLDEEDLALPSADNGSRRVVFEAKVGPISSSSEVYRTCTDRHCVRPDHCEVENVEYRKARLAGTLEEMVMLDGKFMPKAQVERELTTPGTELAYQQDLARRAKEEAGSRDAPFQHLAEREYLMPLGSGLTGY